MGKSKFLKPSLWSLFMAIGLTSAGTFIIGRAVNFPPQPTHVLAELILALSFGSAITTAFYAGFHRGAFLKKFNPLTDPRSLNSETAICVGVTTILYITQFINAEVFYISVTTLLGLTTYLSFLVAMNGVKLQKQYKRYPPWIAAGFVLGAGFLAWPAKNFWPIEHLVIANAFWQTIVHLAGLTLFLGWYTVHPKFRLDKGSILTSLTMRLDTHEKHVSEWSSSIASAALQLTALSAIVAMTSSSSNPQKLVLVLTCQFLYLPGLINAWTELDRAGHDQERLQAFSKLTLQSARNLLTRHNQNAESWAATVGMKTSSFHIDHDTDAAIERKIPAALIRIRCEEIAGFVNQLLKQKNLAITSTSHEISGTLDPENSIRPCVDVLNTCATLYLDAGPMVERRISGLVSLLPIVNHGLSKVINAGSLIHLLKRTQWFFYFDYSWIDQSIINTPQTARYGIHMDPIGAEAKIKILEHMKRSNSLGSFLWLSKDAHDRLLQEAPTLSTIMEPMTLKLSAEQELLLFSIKFEHLIPRLQRYYGLDEFRAKIIDYDPQGDAQRLLTIMGLQIQNARKEQDKLRIIESIASYPWRGFKEKDQALKLLLTLHTMEKSLGMDDGELATGPNKVGQALRRAVSTIGYPSQMMNMAQIYKLQLRDVPKLQAHALNPDSTRFQESWVLLSNIDYSRYPDTEVQSIRQILKEAVRKAPVLRFELVQAKLVDSAVALIRRGRPDELPTDLNLLMTIAENLILAKASAESLCHLLDALTFVAEHTGKPVALSEPLRQYFDSMMREANNKSSVWDQSLWSHWQEYRRKYPPGNASGRKAS